MPDNRVWLVWDRDSFYWDKVNLPWDQAFIVDEVIAAYKGGPLPLVEEETWKHLDSDMEDKGIPRETRKKFLNVVVSVNGLEKESTRELDESNTFVKVDHVKKVFEKATLSNIRVVVQGPSK